MGIPVGASYAYIEAIGRGQKRCGSKFVEPAATYHQMHYFGSPRVEITSPCGYVRRGVIGMTGGWKPSLMLMHRKNASGSWDLLNQTDAVTALIGSRGKRHPIDNAWKQAMREHAV